MRRNFKKFLKSFTLFKKLKRGIKRLDYYKQSFNDIINNRLKYKRLYNYPSLNSKNILQLKKHKINFKLVFIIILSLFILSSIIYIIYPFSEISFKYIEKYNRYIVEFKEEEEEQIIEKSIKELNFKLYTVQNKDNFWQIAKENNLDIDTILGCNPHFNTIYALLNQQVIIPDKKGVIHYMRRGENLRSISKLYNIPILKIKKYNKIQWWKLKRIKEGDIIFIPDIKPKVMTEKMAEFFFKRKIFLSPLSGKYRSRFGWRIHPIYRVRKFHKGLDLRARIGTPVRAVADGVVIFSGWMTGYGKIVRIKHADGYMTGYGHLSRYYVRPGKKVTAGQIIGKSGNSGDSTGPHLDFTIFKNNRPVNPTLYLW